MKTGKKWFFNSISKKGNDFINDKKRVIEKTFLNNNPEPKIEHYLNKDGINIQINNIDGNVLKSAV
ncbi:hypothetical protein SNE26_27870 [Mucilaginibacter sp. cycad4]|uniref:hypothetical protein n=1 Tax=Mucilaginibacter sp. cycad4 TaxID=3342096 RepID=UPI002AAB3E2A|nr:hypothetical protein [Mucilaginibacter gossypii]WPU99829.1 hypothetical protein SNE26_27870 [Mucilaginibacter gossypii]